MRITQSMYFKNIYGENNSQLSKKLFDVNKQIASGVKIQYAKDDIQTFTDTMRLDNEITVLRQIKSSTDSGYKISDQSDVILTEFEDKLIEISPLLIDAINDTNGDASRDAIAKELRSIESNLKNLANSSINGKYLFAGSLVDTRPISEDGTYLGNDVALNAFTGSRVSQQYNVSGAELFLSENSKSPRQITSNVIQTSNVSTTLDTSTTMADYNGTSVSNQHYFYLRGVQSNGTAFNTKIQLNDNNTINDLLGDIGTAYGNGAVDVVNVSMNESGQIVIEDKIKGSSKLDFHMIGATDLGGADNANVNDIDDLGLNGGLTDYALAGASANQLFVREYNKSSLLSSDSVPAGNTLEGSIYDRTEFTKDASILSSNVAQILKTTYVDSNGDETISSSEVNSFAKPSTTISQVADLSQGTAGTLDGTVFVLEGTDVGGAAYTAQIDFASAGSTFTVGGSTYDIFNMETPRVAVDADKMTYQQLMDVINLVVTGAASTLTASPAGTATDYDSKILSSSTSGSTTLSYDGKIQFNDLGASTTQATMSLYDQNSDNFGTDSSVMTFNTNNALTVRDPKSDFFKILDEVISSVESYKNHPDASGGDARNVGMQNALAMVEDLQNQIGRTHSQVGSQSNALTISLERTSLLELSTMTLRSSVIDTDLAEASLSLTQLSLNYEAMLSTVSKISRLSLVNYL